MTKQIEQENILIVDDDKDILQAYQLLLKQQNKLAYVCDNPLDAIDIIPPNWCGVAVIDIYMPYLSGLELMDKIHKIDRQIPVLLITGHGDVPLAVEAVKKGAYDFIEKPIDPALFMQKINTVLAERERHLARKLQKQQQIALHLIGESTWAKTMREKLLAYSLTTLPVYLYGPAGVGKLLAAKQLIASHTMHVNNNHANSNHTNNSHTNHINTNSNHTDITPSSRAEAITAPPNPIEIHNLQQVDNFDDFESWLLRAEHGTLILQHIDLLPTKYQKLLIQYQDVEYKANHDANNQHTGSLDRRFRLIVTSYKSPEQLAAEQILLPEFYYLFSLSKLEFLSLQQRKKDIITIFEYYLKMACKRVNIKRPPLSDLLKKTLTNRQWGNNVSELINAAELFAVGITPTKESSMFCPPDHFFPHNFYADRNHSLEQNIDEYEKNLIINALDLHQGRINEAADYLKIPRKKLYLRMKKHQIDKDRFKY
ncbi:response regulator [Orbaceae bacterium ESL0727]|nr:response regulator [Orbaceae bacterium ESL0727]